MADQVERKLTAILAADVAGYSRLMAADEEGTLARLKSHRRELIDPKIREHRGRIIKTTGDGLLIEFASVVDAVRCAVDVQRGMAAANADVPPDRRIEFRAGINIGDVIVDGDDIYGDGVNIAARLENIADPGGIRVSANVRDQVLDKLGFGLDDLGEQNLKNIARPVRVYAVGLEDNSVVPAKAGTQGNRSAPAPGSSGQVLGPRFRGDDDKGKARKALIPALAAVAALILVAAGVGWFALKPPPETASLSHPPPRAGEGREGAAAAHLSIVVLPFTNLSGDPKQDYLADVLTDELTTYISRIPGSFVIARNTAFTYKGKPTDLKTIGKDLGVRYALEGSVQPTDKRIRTNAQLIDTETGAHLWAEQFDTDKADLLQAEDDIVTRLARTLDVALTEVEAAKGARVRPDNPDAQDLALKCLANVYGQIDYDPKKLAALYEPCEKASQIDPRNVLALSLLAFRHANAVSGGRSRDPATDIRVGNELAARALEIDPNDSLAHAGKALLLLDQGHMDESIVEAERAILLNPSNMTAYVLLCAADNAGGYHDKAFECADKAARLSPHDPYLAQFFFNKYFALTAVQKNAESMEWLDRAMALAPNLPIFWPCRASVLARYGSEKDAREAFRRYLSFPGAQLRTIAQVKAYQAYTYPATDPISVGDRARFQEGLRKAGMPEDEEPRLSIVVLPFQNLSGDAKQDYLADVLTDELTTYISRIPGSFVIARNTAFTYKGKPTDVKTIGKDLGVRYALEGSVQPTTTRIRTNAQLIDTETGAHLWAEQFDTDKADLLETEDEIVTRLARSLDVQLTAVEAARAGRVRPDNPDAQDLALRCLANFNASITVYDPKKIDTLDEPCEQALKLDPRNLIALRLLATRYAQKVYRGVSADMPGDVKRANELIERALAIDPNDAGAHAAKAGVLFDQGRKEESIAEAARAIELNPSDIFAYFLLCGSENGAGKPEKAMEHADRAIRLSPRDPTLFLFFFQKGWAFTWLHRDDDAIAWFRKVLSLAPDSVTTLMILAGELANTGHVAESHDTYLKAVSAGLRIKSLAQYRSYMARVVPSNDPASVAYRERAGTGMRKAGMPEQ